MFQALKKRGLEFFTEKVFSNALFRNWGCESLFFVLSFDDVSPPSVQFLSDSQCVDTLSLEEYSSVLGLVKASKGEDPVSKEKKVVSSKAGPSGSASKAAVSAKVCVLFFGGLWCFLLSFVKHHSYI